MNIKHWLLRWMVLVLLVTGTVWIPQPGAAAEAGAQIHANETDGTVSISGQTSPDDPARVPLLVTDALGQTLYFQDVPGGGQSFAVAFRPPAWTAVGTAVATLYASTPVSDSFAISADSGTVKKKIDVTIRIVGYDGEEIVPRLPLSIKAGGSVFDLLKYAAEVKEFDYEYDDPEGDGHDIYIKSIDGLAEFDKGPGSGWVYKVNGKGPQMPIDRYELEDGDDVEFLYTTDFGASEDVGPDPRNGRILTSGSDVTELDRAYAQLADADSAEKIADVVEALLVALSEYELDKQRTHLPQVAEFFQAAYEQAALVPVSDAKREGDALVQEVSASDVRDLLAEQAELRDRLTSLLADSTLYKPLLAQLKPTLLAAFAKKGDTSSWQVRLTPEAWNVLADSRVRLGVVRDDWRVNLVPVAQAKAGAEQVSFSFGVYSDREQTDQLAEWPSAGAEAPVPLSATYRFHASRPELARGLAEWPLTGTKETQMWPTLYTRKTGQAAWEAVPVLVRVDGDRLTCPIPLDGDAVVIGVTSEFDDVRSATKTRDWVKEPVAALAAMGIVKGTAPRTFDLDKPITRAEFLAMLLRMKAAVAAGAGQTGEVRFVDVPADRWYTPVVREAVARGWAKGRNDGRFAPLERVSRAEAAVLLGRAASSAHETLAAQTSAFRDDKAIPAWARQAVGAAVANGWLAGRTDGRFDPLAGMTRAEAAAALYRYWKQEQTQQDE